MKEKMLELLYRSFDGSLSPAEQNSLQEALSSSAELREEKKRLEILRQTVSDSAERSFQAFFSTRVMQKINAETREENDFFEALAWIFRRVALVGGLAVILLFAGNLAKARSLSLDSLLGLPQVTLEDTYELDNPFLEGEL